MDDSLEKIKDAENRAAKIIEEATHHKEKLISDAKKRAREIIEELESEAKKEREILMEKFKSEIEEERQNRLETAEFTIKKMKSDSKGKIAKEANFLYEKLLEMVE